MNAVNRKRFRQAVILAIVVFILLGGLLASVAPQALMMFVPGYFILVPWQFFRLADRLSRKAWKGEFDDANT